MGVDLNLYLPGHVAVDDLADVVGILLGATRVDGGYSDFLAGDTSVGVPRADAVATDVPGMYEIVVEADDGATLVDGSRRRAPTVHLAAVRADPATGKLRRTSDLALSTSSTPDNVALAIRVARVFGGTLSPWDVHDDSDIDVPADHDVDYADSADDDHYDAWQRLLADLRPLDADDAAEAVALYRTDPHAPNLSSYGWDDPVDDRVPGTTAPATAP